VKADIGWYGSALPGCPLALVCRWEISLTLTLRARHRLHPYSRNTARVSIEMVAESLFKGRPGLHSHQAAFVM
jgi:hypothetical protein